MAANAGAIRAGRAFVELFADDSKLVRGLRAASGKLKAWGSTVTGMGVKLMAGGAAIVGPMLAAAKTFMSAGDALDKMSGRVGVSVEFLSALGHAADLGGSNLEAMENGIRRIQRAAYEASMGTKSYAEAFETLGVQVRGADGQLKGTEQLFMEVAAALSQVENETKRAALAQELFGRSGTALLPMLKGGKAGLLGVMEEAKKLGLVMSTEDATAAAELTDAWTRLTSGAKMAVVQIGAALAPALQTAADWMRQFIRPVIDWIKANRALIATAFKIAVGVTAAGAAFVGVGTALTVAGVAVGGFATAISTVASLLGVLLSPIGLAVAAIAGVVYYSGAAGKALEWLADRFEDLREFAAKAWGGISDAIAAGDISLAFEIVWASIRLVWAKGVAWIKETWQGFMIIWSDITTGIASFMIDAVAAIKTAWVEGLAWIENKINAWGASIMQNSVMSKVLSKIYGLTGSSLSPESIQALGRMNEAKGPKTADTASIEEARREQQRNLRQDKRWADEQRGAAIAAAQAEVDAVRKEWDAAITEAADKRAAMESGTVPETGKPPETEVPDFAGAVAKGGMTVGTFSKWALGGLGMGGGPAERTAKATEKSAEKLDRIEQRLRAPDKVVAVFGE